MDFVVCVLESSHQKESFRELLSQLGKNMNYLIGDFIIQIKNAYLANRNVVTMRYSKLSMAVGGLLVKNRLLTDIKEESIDNKRMIVATLRYVKRKPALHEVQIISKPSLRVYVGVSSLRKLLREESISIISTSKGIMTVQDAAKAKLGGEYLFKVW